MRVAARQRRDERREPGMICRVGIGAVFKQGTDEGQRAVIDRILQAGPIVSGIGPFGTMSGSSTAARKAARSPAEKHHRSC